MALPKKRTRVAVCVLLALLMLEIGLSVLGLIWPNAPGDDKKKKNGFTVDYSNASQGYVMVKYKETDKKLKLQIIKDDETYTYDVNGRGDYEVIPLQMGNGKYSARLYTQVSGVNYAQAASVSFKATLNDEFAPFLCPSQYVYYDADSPAVAQSNELCKDLSSDRDKAQAIYDYVTSHYTYDYILAMTVKSGYLPDVNETYKTQKGICFDVAALIACMMRVQGIPTQLVIGYADRNYHAWNSVYLDGAYQILDATAALTKTKAQSYAVERIY